MVAPSLYELELLGEFRLRIKDLDLNEFLNSDMELLRWIRARENKLDQAELMLRKHLKWRDEVNFDQLMQWDVPKICQDLVPETILGFGDDNCPVIYLPQGKWDIRKVLQEVGPETVLLTRWRNVKATQEALKGKLTSEGVPVTQYNIIVDLERLSIAQGTFAVLRLCSESAHMFEANFPECTKRFVVINGDLQRYYLCGQGSVCRNCRKKVWNGMY